MLQDEVGAWLSNDDANHLVRAAGARVIVAAGPESAPEIWAHARAIARRTGARALLALRPTGCRRPAASARAG
jgi:fatty-acyl-CoA synthase